MARARTCLVVCALACFVVASFAQCNSETASGAVQGEDAGCEPMVPRSRRLLDSQPQPTSSVTVASKSAGVKPTSNKAPVSVAKRDSKSKNAKNLKNEFTDIGKEVGDFFNSLGKEVKTGFQQTTQKIGGWFNEIGKVQPGKGSSKGRRHHHAQAMAAGIKLEAGRPQQQIAKPHSSSSNRRPGQH